MVSAELLRRYPFFRYIDPESLRAVSMAADEVACEGGTVLFEEGQTVDSLYLLIEGQVELSYAAGDDRHRQLFAEQVDPGQVLGISALIEPHHAISTARVASPSRLLKFRARALSMLCEADSRLGYALMRQAAQVAVERLHFALGQYAAAHVPA